jgi:hypothetical protein
LKNICQIEHSCHRSVANFIVNMLTGLTAYSFFPRKPSIKVEFHEYTPQLCLSRTQVITFGYRFQRRWPQIKGNISLNLSTYFLFAV